MSADLGVVVIGRNEGYRLERCLRSLRGRAASVVYVDSGSTDDSVPLAGRLGVAVVQLDRRQPFTMARGRNAGLDHLLRQAPRLRYVQFVDGDCQVEPGWLETALAALAAHPEAAVVCGRRREQHPERTPYNRLADLEWDTPVGEVRACGGDAMMRVDAIWQADGYNDRMIAGEEPELCYRLRRAGWKVLRLDLPMTIHDAAMYRFGQWWRRMMRAGHAFAEGAALHWLEARGYNVRAVRSIGLWGLGGPLALGAGLGLGVAVSPWFLTLAALAPAGYGVLWGRVYRQARQRQLAPADARLYAWFCVLAKFPQAQGVAQYWWNRLRGRRPQLIEYKGPTGTAPPPPTGAASQP